MSSRTPHSTTRTTNTTLRSTHHGRCVSSLVSMTVSCCVLQCIPSRSPVVPRLTPTAGRQSWSVLPCVSLSPSAYHRLFFFFFLMIRPPPRSPLFPYPPLSR